MNKKDTDQTDPSTLVGYDPASTETGASQGELFEADLSEASIPAGAYAAQLTDLFKDVSSSGNDMWVWEFTIAEGQHLGQTLRTYTALTASAVWKLAQVVRALGLPMKDNRACFSHKDAIGRWVILGVKTGSYQGVPRAEIGDVKPWPVDRQHPVEATPF